jgi:hypothetical protein
MPKQDLSAGKTTYRWLSKIARSGPDWFLGSVQGRGNFAAWMVYLADGFRNVDFLLRFEGATDPWQRSRIVGEKVSELRKSFAKLSSEDKLELGKRGETELRSGMELLGRDKKAIADLLVAVDP